MELATKLKKLLYEAGAGLVGIGDMTCLANCNYNRGISVAVPLPANILRDLQTAPTEEYYHMYYSLNDKLNQIVSRGEKYLQDMGYEAYAQTTDRVTVDENRMSKIPHKTVATRAGLGWIGKNCLLVTPQYGAGVRISSLLTNAPLECDESIDQSRCGGCTLCVDKCPAGALYGTLWKAGVERKDIFDLRKCYEKQVEVMKAHTGIQTDLCGKCFAVCAYTQRYLRNRERQRL